MKSNKKTISTFLFLILLFHSNLFSQYNDIKFRHLFVKDGLSQGWVRCIYQDKFGFIWFGTGDGLNRYDGYEFKIYKNLPGNKNTLSNNNIKKIVEDKKGNLWIGTQEGLNLYNRESDNIQPIVSTLQFSIEDIYSNDGGNVLIATPAGLFLYDVIKLALKPLIQNVYANVIFRDMKTNMWLGTFNGLLLITNSSYSYKTFKFNTNDNNIRSICQDKRGRIWLGTNSSGLILMEFRNDNSDLPIIRNFIHKTNNDKSISQGAVLAITDDQHGKLWIGIENGGLDIIDLNSFNPDHCIFNHFMYNSNDITSISSNSVHSIYKDNQNTIWIGTYGGGLNYYNKLAQRFQTVKQIKDNPNSLIDNHINVLYNEGDYLWIGTEDGLTIWNKKNNTFQHYRFNYKSFNSIGANAVWSIFRDSRKNMWIGTWAGGLDLMNEKTKSFVHFRYDPNNQKSIGSNNIFRMIEDKDGELWIATMSGGVNKFDYKTKTFKRYKYDSKVNSLSNDWVENLMEYGNDEIWISTTRAIDIYNKKTGRFLSFRHEVANKKSISHNGATAFFKDSRNNIWIGTEGGLNLFHRNDSSFTYYREENGLPSNTINGIVEDNHGNLWLSTNKGISKFIQGSMVPEKPMFKNYDLSDGLQGNEFIKSSYCKDENGNIYFGGTEGFNVFNPDSIIENSLKSPVVITNLLIFNKPIGINTQNSPLKKIINLTDEITLSHNQSVFTLEYAALNYISTEKNKYAFILEGFEKDWNYVDTKRTATYTNLDPGEYIFRVKASNNDGVWNDEGASLKIKVLPPWWRSVWARIIYIILIGASLYFFRKYTLISTNFKKQLWLEHVEKEKAEELNKLKTLFFTNISHEFRTPLSLILSPLENLLNEASLKDNIKNQLLLIHRNANRLFSLVNDLMDFTKIEDKKLTISSHPNEIVLFTNELFDMFTETATKQKIEYTFQCEHKNILLWFDPDKIEKIILNLLSNAFKFTPSRGRIIVSLEKTIMDKQVKKLNNNNKLNEYVKISVIDNGPGIPKEHLDKIFDRFYQIPGNKQYNQSGTGIGLSLAKSLAELHNGYITVISEPWKETCFSVFLPMNTKFKADESFDSPEVIRKKFIPKLNVNPVIHNKEGVDSEFEKPLILIVEDNYELREYIVSRLQENYRIAEAENGRIGYEKTLETFPDLIISDIKMPEVTGIELCRNVKENISTSHIPVVLLTAKTTTGDKIEGIDKGADAYITKPFNLEFLEVTIRKLIETRKKLFQRFSQDIYIIPKEMSGNPLDQGFLEKSIAYIHQNITNSDLSVENLAFYLLMSRSQTYRKIKALTGQSVTEFIRTIRLKMAITLFEEGELNISEIAFKVGFTSPAYFTKCFRIQFGKSPTEYFISSGEKHGQKQ